ncbi:hypothetical protein GCM10010167_46150 [Paractinoplanes deccanensis]
MVAAWILVVAVLAVWSVGHERETVPEQRDIAKAVRDLQRVAGALAAAADAPGRAVVLGELELRDGCRLTPVREGVAGAREVTVYVRQGEMRTAMEQIRDALPSGYQTELGQGRGGTRLSFHSDAGDFIAVDGATESSSQVLSLSLTTGCRPRVDGLDRSDPVAAPAPGLFQQAVKALGQGDTPESFTALCPDKSGRGSESGPGSSAGSGVGPGAGSSAGPGAGSSAGPGAGSSGGPDAGSSVGPGAGSSVGPGAGSSVGPGAGPSADPGAGSTGGPGVGSSAGPGAGSSVGPGAGPSADPGAGSTGGPGVGSSAGPGAGANAGPGGAGDKSVTTTYVASGVPVPKDLPAALAPLTDGAEVVRADGSVRAYRVGGSSLVITPDGDLLRVSVTTGCGQ